MAKTFSTEPCPGCGSTRGQEEPGNKQAHACAKCGGLIASLIYLGDSYVLVKPFMADAPCAEPRYFDFTCVGSSGVTRRHGWFDPASRLVVQAG